MLDQPLQVINLFGAPGIGKSGCASGLFSLMKSSHQSVQLITEVAKALQLGGQGWRLDWDQCGIFGLQQYEQLVLRGKYEYAITDSPLMLCAFYGKRKYPDSYYSLVRESFEEYENHNFFLWRDLDTASPFETEGRAHDREMSRVIQERMPEFLTRNGIAFKTIEVQEDRTSWQLLDEVKPGLKKAPSFDRTDFDIAHAL